VKPGQQYQNLSVLTGGLRFPICQYSSFDSVFQAIADDVVTHVQIACDFAIPAAPAGQTLNLDDVAVEYTPLGGATTTFARSSTRASARATRSPSIARPTAFTSAPQRAMRSRRRRRRTCKWSLPAAARFCRRGEERRGASSADTVVSGRIGERP
jgi:hypothetical protein